MEEGRQGGSPGRVRPGVARARGTLYAGARTLAHTHVRAHARFDASRAHAGAHGALRLAGACRGVDQRHALRGHARPRACGVVHSPPAPETSSESHYSARGGHSPQGWSGVPRRRTHGARSITRGHAPHVRQRSRHAQALSGPCAGVGARARTGVGAAGRRWVPAQVASGAGAGRGYPLSPSWGSVTRQRCVSAPHEGRLWEAGRLPVGYVHRPCNRRPALAYAAHRLLARGG
jgi:hypothetical protein